MRMVSTLILLTLIGFAAGLLLAWMTKRRQTGGQTVEQMLSANVSRQLAQLKSQLSSGLITREEYEAKKQEILEEL